MVVPACVIRPGSSRLLGYPARLVGQEPWPPFPKLIPDDIHVLNHNGRLATTLPFFLRLRLGLLSRLGHSIGLFLGVVGAWLDELVLHESKGSDGLRNIQSLSEMTRVSYVSENHTALLENLWLVVVVNVEPREEYFVLVAGDSTLAAISQSEIASASLSHMSLTANRASASRLFIPPSWISDQNVVLYRLLIWPGAESASRTRKSDQ